MQNGQYRLFWQYPVQRSLAHKIILGSSSRVVKTGNHKKGMDRILENPYFVHVLATVNPYNKCGRQKRSKTLTTDYWAQTTGDLRRRRSTVTFRGSPSTFLFNKKRAVELRRCATALLPF
jgi:hypothetical protein